MLVDITSAADADADADADETDMDESNYLRFSLDWDKPMTEMRIV